MHSRIKKIRTDAGLSMAKFGAIIGITSSAVNHIEHGVNNPAERTLSAICREFGVRREWLDSGEGPAYIDNLKTAKAIEWAGETLAGDDSFKRRFLEVLSHLDPAEWDLIEKIVDELANKNSPDT